VRTLPAVNSGWRDQKTAANPAACGAAADVPPNGSDRHELANGTGATRSGLGDDELGPQELYDARRPPSHAPTVSHAGLSPGKAILPR
jgi:hypothetical protein